MPELPSVEEMLGYKLEVRYNVRRLIDTAAASHDLQIQKLVVQKKLAKNQK